MRTTPLTGQCQLYFTAPNLLPQVGGPGLVRLDRAYPNKQGLSEYRATYNLNNASGIKHLGKVLTALVNAQYPFTYLPSEQGLHLHQAQSALARSKFDVSVTNPNGAHQALSLNHLV